MILKVIEIGNSKDIRSGWEEQFRNAVSPHSIDVEVWLEPSNKFDEEEWQW